MDSSLVLERRELQKRKERERKRRSRKDPTFRKKEAGKSAARMRAKQLNPLFREAEAARQREKRNQQKLSRDEQRLKDPRYIAAESSFKMQIYAVDPGLYKAGRVGDTNKDTTNHRKRISRLANNKKDTDLNINWEDGKERPTMDQKG